MVLVIIAFIATFTSTISLLPQLYQTYKTKSVEDLSLLMLINFAICSLSWVAYGFLTHATTVWLTNIFMTFSSIILLGFKLKYNPKSASNGK